MGTLGGSGSRNEEEVKSRRSPVLGDRQEEEQPPKRQGSLGNDSLPTPTPADSMSLYTQCIYCVCKPPNGWGSV